MNHHGLDAAIFVERAAKTAHRGCAILNGVVTFVQNPEEILHSLNYLFLLPEQ